MSAATAAARRVCDGENFCKVVERVTLEPRRVGLLAEDDRLTGEPLCFVEVAVLGANESHSLPPARLSNRVARVSELVPFTRKLLSLGVSAEPTKGAGAHGRD